MAYRNKTYVCFDGDNDIRYYNLMKAWKQNDNTNFNFYDAHDINTALDSSTEETIKRRLRERLINSKVLEADDEFGNISNPTNDSLYLNDNV